MIKIFLTILLSLIVGFFLGVAYIAWISNRPNTDIK